MFDSPAFCMDSTNQDAALFRRAIGSLINPAGGIVTPGDLAVTQQATPNMSVSIAPGQIWIPGTSLATQGPYYSQNHGPITQPITTASSTNPRIDTIGVQITDAGYAGPLNTYTCTPLYEMGTPTAGLTTPPTTAAQAATDGAGTLPASSLAFAYVLVPKNATSIVTADIANVATQITLPTALAAPGAWQPLTLASGFVSAGGYTPSARLIGSDIVQLKGILENTSGGTVGGLGSTLATIPAGLRPSATIFCTAQMPNQSISTAQITTAGAFSVVNSFGNDSFLGLDGITYTLS